MHRQSFYRSCEVLCCSMLGVDSEEMLVVALVKQNAMVTLHQLLNTRGKSILCWHAADMLPEAVLTCFAIEYGWSPCNGACTPHRGRAGACVMGRISIVLRLVTRSNIVSMWTRAWAALRAKE